MKPHSKPIRLENRGFALVVTLSLMILLTLMAVGLLSLSAVTLRSASQGTAQAEARANARLALMLAIGELQKEMGPDMRVSAESALFDQNQETEDIEGVDQSHWLASYDAWGDWLNASYTLPDGGGTLKIPDTYTPKREKMFRRWLLSLPEGMENDVDAPTRCRHGTTPTRWCWSGEGSLGDRSRKPQTGDELDKVTRAYLTPVGKTGKQAWWIGPENHKARINLAKQPRTLGNGRVGDRPGRHRRGGGGRLAGLRGAR